MTQIGLETQGIAQLGPLTLQHNFEELALPLWESAYDFAHWLVRNQADAEDLVQETYLKALRGFATFKGNSNFRTWMFRILKNTFLTKQQRAGRHVSIALDAEELTTDSPAGHKSVESILLNRFRMYAIQKAIEQLPLPSRKVLLLCDIEGASYREIAGILSIPIGTVMSRLARARAAVRESIRGTSRPAASQVGLRSRVQP